MRHPMKWPQYFLSFVVSVVAATPVPAHATETPQPVSAVTSGSAAPGAAASAHEGTGSTTTGATPTGAATAGIGTTSPTPTPARIPTQKKFKRALIIAGGGISPGVSLGLIAGAEAAGYHPDVVIATCGASLGATIYNSYPTDNRGWSYARSRKYYDVLKSLVQIETTSSLSMLGKMSDAEKNTSVLPDFFHGNILRIPEHIARIVPNDQFPMEEGKPRFIILGAKANFSPADSGQPLPRHPLFREVFFTDADTAQVLKNLRSPIKRLFPASSVESRTDVITGVSMTQAARAGVADPFLINPALIGKDYYFTGAIDLFPIETAREIADEVMVTYPSALYDHYENLAVLRSFGFSQSQRAYAATLHHDVKWIDVTGILQLNFDPAPGVLLDMLNISSNVPSTYENFTAAIDRQFSFGYWRAMEAVKLQQSRLDVRTHLRAPLPRPQE